MSLKHLNSVILMAFSRNRQERRWAFPVEQYSGFSLLPGKKLLRPYLQEQR
jgi:hypothetical protein